MNTVVPRPNTLSEQLELSIERKKRELALDALRGIVTPETTLGDMRALLNDPVATEFDEVTIYELLDSSSSIRQEQRPRKKRVRATKAEIETQYSRIMDIIRESGAATAMGISERLGISDSIARTRLTRLTQSGELAYESESGAYILAADIDPAVRLSY